MRRIVICLALLAFVPLAMSQDAKTDRVKAIRQEIESLRAKLAKLEAELAKLDDNPYIGPIKTLNGKKFFAFKTGDVGHVGTDIFKVSQILQVDDVGNGRNDHAIFILENRFRFLANGVTLKGLSDGSVVEFKGTWKVGVPIKIGSFTYQAIHAESGAAIIAK